MSTAIPARAAFRAPAPHADAERLGVWGPGIRLLRRMHFTAKAVLVSMAVVLPLLTLVGGILKGQVDQTLQQRREATRQVVEVATGMVRWAHAQGWPARFRASRPSSWPKAPWPPCATAATNTSGSTTCSRAWSCTPRGRN